jgi:plasmid stabilization system protein ParE
MNDYSIVFSPRALSRLEELTDYLFTETQSSDFVIKYINSLEEYLESVLRLFPESGTRVTEYGEGIRRIVFKEYSFLYRIGDRQIEILTVYKENLP